MMTMMESATRHMVAGVMDPGELARLVEADTGRAPSRNTLDAFRSQFRRHGDGWVKARREAIREFSSRWKVDNPEDPESRRERSRRWKADNPARKLLQQCRGSAKSRGQECTITADDIEEMLAPMTCSATGLPLTWEHDGSTRANPWAPSIDRLDCSRGYVPGNVRVVCWAFNQMRGEFPDDVVRTLAEAAHRALNGTP